MDWNSIHYIKDSLYNIIFIGNTLDIILADSSIFKTLEGLKNGQDANFENNDLNKIVQLSHQKTKIQTIDKKTFSPKKLNKITLHVTNGCNLKCKYCYANEGTYNTPVGLLTKETANDFINFCQHSFEKVERIMFFGGEPFINIDIMSYICESFHKKHDSGEIQYTPTFGVITNGTLLNEKIIKFIKKHISSITISIDGPKEINDKNRIFKDGTGTYDTISKFINTIRNNTEVNILLESTFTREHINQGYTQDDIKSFLQKEFNTKAIVISENDIDLEEIKTFNPKYNQIEETDFPYLPNIFWQVLDRISKRETSSICPIHRKVIAVSTIGDIYPCHLLIGKENTYLGNIKSNNIYSNPSLYKNFSDKILSKENPKCQTCWANRICGGCAVRIFYDEKTADFKYNPKEEYCDSIKECIDKIISLIVYIKKNPILWQKLLKYNKNKLT